MLKYFTTMFFKIFPLLHNIIIDIPQILFNRVIWRNQSRFACWLALLGAKL